MRFVGLKAALDEEARDDPLDKPLEIRALGARLGAGREGGRSDPRGSRRRAARGRSPRAGARPRGPGPRPRQVEIKQKCARFRKIRTSREIIYLFAKLMLKLILYHSVDLETKLKNEYYPRVQPVTQSTTKHFKYLT